MKYYKKEHKPIITLILNLTKKVFKKGKYYDLTYRYPEYKVVIDSNCIFVREGKENEYLFCVDLNKVYVVNEKTGKRVEVELTLTDNYIKKGYEKYFPLFSIRFEDGAYENIGLYKFNDLASPFGTGYNLDRISVFINSIYRKSYTYIMMR